MSKYVRRPSPALIIALIALFAALGGTVYAANKINGKTIKVNSIPGNRIKPQTLTGKQIKLKTLARVPKAEQAIYAETAVLANSAQNAANADKVDGRDATCAAGTQLYNGSCWESEARPATNATTAAADCSNRGGSLPGAHDLVGFSKIATLANTDEWSSDINGVVAMDNYTAVIVSKAGSINATAWSDPKQYRCVFPLLR